MIRFGPALKASFLCLLIAGSAVGYVWQKSQIYQLGQQIRQQEIRLAQMKDTNQKLGDQLAMLRSPTMLDKRARELNLGLGLRNRRKSGGCPNLRRCRPWTRTQRADWPCAEPAR